MSDSISVPTGYGNETRVSVNLTVANAYRDDTGVYTCGANNSIGNDSMNVSITVQCKSTLRKVCSYSTAQRQCCTHFSITECQMKA